VANGRGPTGGDGERGGPLRSLGDALENRIVILFGAAVLGVGGNFALIQSQPDVVRPDPFTGTMGKALENRIIALENLTAELDHAHHDLQVRQAMDDQHRKDAVDGYARIRAIERQCALNNERINEIRREWNRMKERGLLRE